MKKKIYRPIEFLVVFGFVLIVFLFGTFNVFAESIYTEDVFNYTVENDSATICGCFGQSGTVRIPGVIAGYTVNKIAANAFSDNTYVKNVEVPDTVTKIEDGAFAKGIQITYYHYEAESQVAAGTEETGDAAPPPEMTATPAPEATVEPGVTATPAPEATATPAPGTTATPAPGTTTTPAPEATATPAPGATATPAPGATATPAPGTTTTPAPGATATPAPGTTTTPAPDTTTTPAGGTSSQGAVSDVTQKSSGSGETAGTEASAEEVELSEDGTIVSKNAASDQNSTVESIAAAADAESQVQREESHAFPWAVLIIIALIVLCVIGIMVYRRRKNRKG